MPYQQDFIKALLPGAVAMQRKSGLPAVVMMCQVCLETGYGKSVVRDKHTGQYSYNLYNIKGKGPAGSVLVDCDEYYNGKHVYVEDWFKAYNSYEESCNDYVNFIYGNSRYKPAIAVANDPVAYAVQLQKCGYATDPNYASKLMSIARTFNIFQLVDEELKRQEAYAMEQAQQNQTPSAFAIKSIEKAKASGIMLGDQNGWNPHGVITREMLAVILDRLGLLDSIDPSLAGEVQKMLDAGIIHNTHVFNHPVKWGELAAVINRSQRR